MEDPPCWLSAASWFQTKHIYWLLIMFTSHFSLFGWAKNKTHNIKHRILSLLQGKVWLKTNPTNLFKILSLKDKIWFFFLSWYTDWHFLSARPLSLLYKFYYTNTVHNCISQSFCRVLSKCNCTNWGPTLAILGKLPVGRFTPDLQQLLKNLVKHCSIICRISNTGSYKSPSLPKWFYIS